MDEPIILYLDQNKWIDIARGVNDPDRYPEFYKIVELLVSKAKAEKIIVPLTFANIYETFKIKNAMQRNQLAWVQATLSHGRFFRGRHHLLKQQIAGYLSSFFGVSSSFRDANWFLTDLFFETVCDYDPAVFELDIKEDTLNVMRKESQRSLYSYIVHCTDDERASAVKFFSNSSRELILKIEERRQKTKLESLDLRYRLYAVLLLRDSLDLFSEVAKELGFPNFAITDLGEARILELISRIPMFDIEQNLVMKLENEDTVLDENDLRDCAAFNCVVKYADIVVAENAFIGRTKQANLDKKYRTKLLTKIADLSRELDK